MGILTCEIRHRDATPAIRAQRQLRRLPRRRSTLVRETAERIFGKRGCLRL